MFTVAAKGAPAEQKTDVRSPASGVLCDPYLCANEKGISRALTAQYLGETTAAKLFSQGQFSLTEFTLSNGVFCDTKERLCREDRYYGPDGKRSGAVSKKYTELLFHKPGQPINPGGNP
ncbi:MAG: YcgJ family protein [Pigmentiphaga sp.]|uniref:YcgJ family protein n=1 Tax=Pigmentiphaga sp. TaxID=1977564 RepID=UPI0029A5AF49|nr:YcgJ family protein [Pigmentiphaga sp.]MDX3905571.1 YcgJ family protein [Pigmentiphaga sp.]